MGSAVRTAANWMFRDRATGRVVIAQRPNLLLTVWFVCVTVRWLVEPNRPWSTVLNAISSAALVIWAGDEVARGVNPWRRALGAGVLVALLLGWALAR